MGKNTALVKNIRIFAIGNFGSKVLIFLVVPFFTYYINPNGMGVYDVIYAAVQLLQTVAVLAIPEALFRWLLDEDIDTKAVLSNWARLFSILFLLFSILYPIIWALFRFSDPVIIYLLIATGSIYVGLQFATRGLHNNKLFAIQGIVYSVSLCLASAIFVILLDLDYQGLLYSMLTGNIVAIAVMLFAQKSDLSVNLKSIDKPLSLAMLKYSVLMLPNTLSWWVISSLGKITILLVLGTYANGIYAISSRFPSVLFMLSTVFQQAWNEHAVSEYESDDRNRHFSQVFSTYARLLLGATILLIPATKLIIELLLSSSYNEASDYIGILYIGAVFAAFSYFFGTDYICRKDSKGAATTTIVGAIINCVLSVILVVPLGIYGIAISYSLSQLATWLLRYKHYRDYVDIEVNWKLLLSLILIACTGTIICLFTDVLITAFTAIVSALICIVVNKKMIVQLAMQIKHLLRHQRVV